MALSRFRARSQAGQIMNRHLTSMTTVVLLSLSVAVSARGPGDSTTELKVEIPPVVSRSTLLGRTDPNKVVHITVSLPFNDPKGIQAFNDRVSNPASPDYRRFIEPSQVGALFGLPFGRVQAVADYLNSKGLSITLVAQNRLAVMASGTVASAERAFGTVINEYQARSNQEPGRLRYFSFSTPLRMPSSMASDVVNVSGLENFTKPMPKSISVNQARVLYNTAPFYNNGFRGQGRTIAISNFDGFRLSNLAPFYAQYSLPTPPGGVGSNVTVLPINGGSGNGAPAGEGDLDIQMVLGTAPLCSFVIYDGVDLIGTLAKEADDNIADIISESYGWSLSISGANAAHDQHLSMTAQGITYMEASGDYGTSLEPFSYSNYEPEVLQIGGTTATTSANGVRIGEVGWSGSGGGWVTRGLSWNVRPSWQKGTGVPNINYRLNPDLAFHSASPTGAYDFFYEGSLTAGDGTSFASPLFAGMLGTAQQKLIALGKLPPNGKGKRRMGRIQDLIYSHNGRSDVYFDIKSGQNGLLPDGTVSQCTPKWDTVTGWGAIDMDKWIAVVAAGQTGGTKNKPVALSLVQGNYQSGNLANVANGTGSGYIATSTTVNNVGESAIVELDYKLNAKGNQLLSVEPKVKLSCSNTSADLTGQLFVWNWATSKWELQASTRVVRTGTSVQFSSVVDAGLTKYVDSTGNFKTLVRFLSPVGRRGEPGSKFKGAVRFAESESVKRS